MSQHNFYIRFLTFELGKHCSNRYTLVSKHASSVGKQSYGKPQTVFLKLCYQLWPQRPPSGNSIPDYSSGTESDRDMGFANCLKMVRSWRNLLCWYIYIPWVRIQDDYRDAIFVDLSKWPPWRHAFKKANIIRSCLFPKIVSNLI